ncbi:uncharacterized protein LOC105249764 [Camponotus floridanus]|uniref:uncharacterized protein LOC105249764 n=1 Tax=Camponotus floridanus TaxID=104421 RepID=UPI00059E5675|nr:uncharacterized protein LOC105249764 [Camponotus floridanus]
MQMHPRAFHVLALALIAVVRVGCDDKARWYSGLRSVLQNCSPESRNSSGQDELLEIFKGCIQQRIVDTLDVFLDNDIIPVFEGIDLIRFRPNDDNSTRESKSKDNASWSTIIWNQLARVLRTHAFKVNIEHMFNTTSSELDQNSNIVQSRRRHRRRHRHHHFLPFMMMGLLLMGSILVPMGFQFLAVLGGKALILAKMALILSSIQGLKKIATSGINYGLYHVHDRSHQVLPEEENQFFVPPHP